MADISGLQMAFQAWKSVTDGKEPTLPGVNLNAQQLFFLNAAQVCVSFVKYFYSDQFIYYRPFEQNLG